jgi:rhamnosyl/mannosyltransferase
VGEGDFKSELIRRVKLYQVEDNVIFAEKVSDFELPKYYAACDVFVLPSVTRLEAFGIVGLEAMATGKPVIISNIPGVRDVITNGVEGLYVEPVNAKDIAAKVNMLIGDKTLRLRLGANGRKKVVNKYQWSKVVKAVENVYLNLCA